MRFILSRLTTDLYDKNVKSESVTHRMNLKCLFQIKDYERR